MLGKVKDVISENEHLTDQARGVVHAQLHHQCPDSSESSTDPNEEIAAGEFSFLPKKKVGDTKTVLHGPSIVFESRISELEAQLTQASIDFKKVSDENDRNKRALANGEGISAAVAADAGSIDSHRRQVETLKRDKNTLEETVRKLQDTIESLKASDASNFTKSQMNRDLADRSSFERVQMEIDIKRLKEELERQHARVREVQHEMAKKVAEERAIAERRYNYQVDQLGGDLSSQWEVASRLQLEVERQKRMENDFRRELAQKNAQIDELKSELKAKTGRHFFSYLYLN